MSLFNLILQSALPWLLLLLLGVNNVVSAVEEYQTYIIHMDHCQKPAPHLTHETWHQSILKSLSSSPADEEELLLYSYSHVMHGFSARLTPTQLSEIQNSSAHIATYPESFGKLFTTYTPEFLGLQHNAGIWPAASYGEDVIVGILDTGIWPESESFNDEGMSPVPQRWKGKCETGASFNASNCNRKLIGARSFSKGIKTIGISEEEYDSARDFGWHGTHTSSTAVGKYVPDVSYFGYARGTAKGVAPNARLAMYKVNWETATKDTAATDILAGMEQAILDGVDIMSLSLGINQTSYFTDAIAKGALSAIEKGIFVVCSAGNDGDFKTIYNGAPWITTVAATTHDRSFVATMTLKNGLTMEGRSYFAKNVSLTNLKLYYGKGNMSKTICNDTALDRNEVAGKVVICDSNNANVSQQISEAKRAGASAAIFLTDSSYPLEPEDYVIPSLILPNASGTLVKKYVTSVRNPMVKRMKFVLTRFGTKPAPRVAHFSSKGPNPITPGILKPDIVAPGVDVLAAVQPYSSLEVDNNDVTINYGLMSGSSMSTPIVAGVGALLRAVHPKWSPAAIRSAIMTTAYTKDNTGTTMKAIFKDAKYETATPLHFGAGHISPNEAMDPGLIYDMGFQDYVDFLCGLGYTNEQMRLILKRNEWHCSKKLSHELNYPSFMVALSNETTYPTAMNFNRVVTNVGNDTSIYQAHLENIPTGMKIKVEPNILTFTEKNQKQSFVVSVEIDRDFPKIIYCFLKWIDQHSHIVSSPITAINF
uniref:Subtilisin-like protease fibronectin type-III domain-containing protein n=1 Tax=Fagus sylvatica TaxID=28930 RepID=A0A2N9HXS0_FAGSY